MEPLHTHTTEVRRTASKRLAHILENPTKPPLKTLTNWPEPHSNPKIQEPQKSANILNRKVGDNGGGSRINEAPRSQ
ncbi:unnamed protein product [Eruca vesicaria subsp. sativa]|uniref:Uncharacterized protein n=1 Tax=Eruca vesicaria subsp. sativa TaxID=29727 RepID=A0ABC8IT44_ERUVS|nr:unnamed protein product [Eruca vesicaria subsp. sativa]